MITMMLRCGMKDNRSEWSELSLGLPNKIAVLALRYPKLRNVPILGPDLGKKGGDQSAPVFNFELKLSRRFTRVVSNDAHCEPRTTQQPSCGVKQDLTNLTQGRLLLVTGWKSGMTELLLLA